MEHKLDDEISDMRQEHKITMTQTRRGTNDGFTTYMYECGETYSVDDHLARQFVANGWARRA